MLASRRVAVVEEAPCLPLNQMQPARCLHNAAHLTRLKRKGRILEFLLHVAVSKVA